MIGHSPKLIQFVESIFPITEKSIISWRSLPLSKEEEKNLAAMHWDVLLVCGYNYKTSAASFKDCLAKNVSNVLAFAEACVGKDIRVIYTNTQGPTRKYTWSRYLYAKMLLGDGLVGNFTNTDVLEFPTIFQYGNISTTGGLLSKTAFRILDSLGCLSKVTINQSNAENIKLFHELKATPIIPKPILLEIPRPLIVDRFLRLIFG